jgi:hypothetical protein
VPRMLPPDATLKDVRETLAKPAAYVCGVLDNLYKAAKQHGNAAVRIGVTGSGSMPYYRITYDLPDGKQGVFDTFFDNHVSFSAGRGAGEWRN